MPAVEICCTGHEAGMHRRGGGSALQEIWHVLDLQRQTSEKLTFETRAGK